MRAWRNWRDAADSKSVTLETLWVQIPPPAPLRRNIDAMPNQKNSLPGVKLHKPAGRSTSGTNAMFKRKGQTFGYPKVKSQHHGENIDVNRHRYTNGVYSGAS